MAEKDTVAVRSIIHAQFQKRILEGVSNRYDPELWRRIFVLIFDKEPISGCDPLWDKLLHKYGYAGLSMLAEIDAKRKEVQQKRAV